MAGIEIFRYLTQFFMSFRNPAGFTPNLFRTGMFSSDIEAKHTMFYNTHLSIVIGFQRIFVIFWAEYIT